MGEFDPVFVGFKTFKTKNRTKNWKLTESHAFKEVQKGRKDAELGRLSFPNRLEIIRNIQISPADRSSVIHQNVLSDEEDAVADGDEREHLLQSNVRKAMRDPGREARTKYGAEHGERRDIPRDATKSKLVDEREVDGVDRQQNATQTDARSNVHAVEQHEQRRDNLAFTNRHPTGEHTADERRNEDRHHRVLWHFTDTRAMSARSENQRSHAENDGDGAKQQLHKKRVRMNQQRADRAADQEPGHGVHERLKRHNLLLDPGNRAARHAETLAGNGDFESSNGRQVEEENHHRDEHDTAAESGDVPDDGGAEADDDEVPVALEECDRFFGEVEKGSSPEHCEDRHPPRPVTDAAARRVRFVRHQNLRSG